MTRGGFGDMMKQVQVMQAKMAAMQEAMEKTEIEATSGGGMVKVVTTGKNEIKSITIDPEVVDKEDIDMLQDLIVAAVNQAREKVQEMQAEKMSQITGGLNLPGLGGLPF